MDDCYAENERESPKEEAAEGREKCWSKQAKEACFFFHSI